MHQTNHRGHNQTSTATTQNQLAYTACRRWREISARPDTIKHTGVQHINEYRQLTRHDLGYRLNPFPHSVISNSALVACRSSVFDVRGRACSGCAAQHPANPSASPSTAVLHGDSACVG